MLEKFLMIQISLFCTENIAPKYDSYVCEEYMVSCITSGLEADDCADFFEEEFTHYKEIK